jgi:hypothetical protein
VPTCIFLKTEYVANARLAEGKFLLEEPRVNKGRCPKLREITLIPAGSSKEGKNLYIL